MVRTSRCRIGALKSAEAAALRLLETRIEGRPILSSWDALVNYLHATMAHLRTEEVRILFLNAKNLLLANEALRQGSVDEAFRGLREALGPALKKARKEAALPHGGNNEQRRAGEGRRRGR